MPLRLRYHSNAERPAAEGWWLKADGTLLDLSAGGYTFVLKIGHPGSPALLTKSSNIVGAVGAGVEPTGTPNITITWTAGELALAPGTYACQITATIAGLDRTEEGQITILDVIT